MIFCSNCLLPCGSRKTAQILFDTVQAPLPPALNSHRGGSRESNLACSAASVLVQDVGRRQHVAAGQENSVSWDFKGMEYGFYRRKRVVGCENEGTLLVRSMLLTQEEHGWRCVHQNARASLAAWESSRWFSPSLAAAIEPGGEQDSCSVIFLWLDLFRLLTNVSVENLGISKICNIVYLSIE